jgi:hypothetical protein
MTACGLVSRLLHWSMAADLGGVKWEQPDHLYVAGELLPAEPVGPRRAIRGELVELSR